MDRILNGQHSNCTIIRTWHQKSYSWNIVTGEKSNVQEQVVTGPCDTPLFGAEEKMTGVCRSCHQGHEMDGNVFATPEERDRAIHSS